jgi:hypothetical protein
MCNCHRIYPDGRHLPSCRFYESAEVDIDLSEQQTYSEAEAAVDGIDDVQNC